MSEGNILTILPQAGEVFATCGGMPGRGPAKHPHCRVARSRALRSTRTSLRSVKARMLTNTGCFR